MAPDLSAFPALEVAPSRHGKSPIQAETPATASPILAPATGQGSFLALRWPPPRPSHALAPGIALASGRGALTRALHPPSSTARPEARTTRPRAHRLRRPRESGPLVLRQPPPSRSRIATNPSAGRLLAAPDSPAFMPSIPHLPAQAQQPLPPEVASNPGPPRSWSIRHHQAPFVLAQPRLAVPGFGRSLPPFNPPMPFSPRTPSLRLLRAGLGHSRRPTSGSLRTVPIGC